jgi:hypothetical protein
MNYLFVPSTIALIGFISFMLRFDFVSSLKWLGIVLAAELLSFLPLMGLPGMVGLGLGTVWTKLVYGKWIGDVVTGDVIWPTAMGVTIIIPPMMFFAEIVTRHFFGDQGGFSRWCTFIAVMLVMSSLAPLLFVYMDESFAATIRR